MSPTRSLLVWLCCTLVLWTGVPLSAKTVCDAGGASNAPVLAGDVSDEGVFGDPDAGACCGQGCDCCSHVRGLARKCDCGERSPEREPATPAPRVPQVAIPAPEWPSARVVIAPRPRTHGPRIRVPSPIGLLPRVSRQKALSVWRC